MRTIAGFAAALAIALAPGAARSLDILLTNDDGYQNPGINTLRAALCAAGHAVTMVAPATNQSGRGGSLNTGVLSSSSAMALTLQSSDACGDVYSLAGPTAPGTYGGTPVDSMHAGLQVLLAGDPPDLVVSGNNFGQNLGKPTSNGSGTIGAALQASYEGIPAIATSVGLLTSESPAFPSTIAAFGPAAAFIVKLIATLEAVPGPRSAAAPREAAERELPGATRRATPTSRSPASPTAPSSSCRSSTATPASLRSSREPVAPGLQLRSRSVSPAPSASASSRCPAPTPSPAPTPTPSAPARSPSRRSTAT